MLSMRIQKKKEATEDLEQIVKRGVREAVGKIDPQIKHGVEDALKTVSYRRKTKVDALGDVADCLEKRLEALKTERFALEKYPCKETRKNPLLDLNTEEVSEDNLQEVEILRAYKQKDTEKLELLLLKSKIRLEEMEKKHSDTKPVHLTNLQAMEKSTLSVSMTSSQINNIYEKAKNKPSLTNSSVVSPYLTASTSVSQSFSPGKSRGF